MDRSDVIKLIGQTMAKDKYGVYRSTVTAREVYCQVDSITQSEFYSAGREGLNPAFKFTLFYGDYNDETVVEYKGKTYAVYRTYYRRTDRVELYVERKGGTNGIKEPTTPTVTT